MSKPNYQLGFLRVWLLSLSSLMLATWYHTSIVMDHTYQRQMPAVEQQVIFLKRLATKHQKTRHQPKTKWTSLHSV